MPCSRTQSASMLAYRISAKSNNPRRSYCAESNGDVRIWSWELAVCEQMRSTKLAKKAQNDWARRRAASLQVAMHSQAPLFLDSIFILLSDLPHHCKADVPLRNYSLTHSLSMSSLRESSLGKACVCRQWQMLLSAVTDASDSSFTGWVSCIICALVRYYEESTTAIVCKSLAGA